MTETTKPTGLAALREPFPAEAIGLLPKALSPNDREKFQCRQGTKASADGKFCGGYHTRSMHVEFVGHADATARLLEADPEWNWAPMATDPTGMPLLDRDGNLWINLTICGVTRPGVGDGATMKIKVGDALRNAAMRFGVALDLWAKGDREWAKTEDREEADAKPTPRQSGAQRTASAIAVLSQWQVARVREHWPAGLGAPETLTDAQADQVAPIILHWAGQQEPPQQEAIPPA